MAERWSRLGAVLLAVCPAIAASDSASAPPAAGPAAAGKVSRFNVGAVAFEMPTPEGFCPPTGAQVATVELMTQADNPSAMLLALFPCASAGSAPIGSEYMIVKAPKMFLDQDLSRTEMLKLLGAAFENPAFKEGMAAGRADVTKAFEAKSGQKVEMVGEVGPRGRDDVCAYLGGSPEVKSAGGSVRLSIGACLTVVGNRFLVLLVCAPDTPGTAVPAMVARARRFVETIRRTS